eukprot:scaffold54262_cov57-Phaeocystis_antarctica.AAC.1
MPQQVRAARGEPRWPRDLPRCRLTTGCPRACARRLRRSTASTPTALRRRRLVLVRSCRHYLRTWRWQNCRSKTAAEEGANRR